MNSVYYSGYLSVLLVCWACSLSFAGQRKICKSCDLTSGQEKRVLAVRGQILTKLGLTEPPLKDGDSVNVTREVLDTFNTVVQEREKEFNGQAMACGAGPDEEVEYFAKEILRLPLLEEHAKAILATDSSETSLRDVYLLKFNLSKLLTEGNDVSRAHLRLHVTPNAPQINGDVRIDVCGNNDEATSHKSVDHTCGQVLDSKWTSGREAEWISFDVTSHVRDWCVEGSEKSAIKVVVRSNNDGDSKVSAIVLGGAKLTNPREYLPHVLAWVVPRVRKEAAKRRRRRALDWQYCRKKRPKERRCCLRSLYVDFRKDLRWHWVHAPSGFYANYCAGECPFMWGSSKQKHHSTVMALYNSVNPEAPGDPCCVAKAYKPLVILYYKDGQPKIEELKNMVVSRCTCL